MKTVTMSTQKWNRTKNDAETRNLLRKETVWTLKLFVVFIFFDNEYIYGARNLLLLYVCVYSYEFIYLALSATTCLIVSFGYFVDFLLLPHSSSANKIFTVLWKSFGFLYFLLHSHSILFSLSSFHSFNFSFSFLSIHLLPSSCTLCVYFLALPIWLYLKMIMIIYP